MYLLQFWFQKFYTISVAAVAYVHWWVCWRTCCRRYYTGLTARLLPSRCGYTRSTYNPTRPGFLLGLRRDLEFRDFFVDGINSACRALNVSVQLASIRDLYPTYTWKDLAAHRGIVPLPCQPSMMAIIEQYRMNIPLFLPSKVSFWCMHVN